MENLKNIIEMSAIGSSIDNSDVNPIHRSTSLNVNEEPTVSRLSSGKLKIGPSSNPPQLITNNKWYYKDYQGKVQGPFLTTKMVEWYSLGYFHNHMLMVKRACDGDFYTLCDLVRFKGNVPFCDTPFTEQDVKFSGVQPTPTQNPQTMNASLLLQQQQLQHYQQYRPVFVMQRELAMRSAVYQFSKCEKWNKMSQLEQHELLMNHMRNVEGNIPMDIVPILPQQQHQPNIHHMNPPANYNLMETSDMQQQQQQRQQQQHFNHQIDPKHAVPHQPMAQQLDPFHCLVQSRGGLKTSEYTKIGADHKTTEKTIKEEGRQSEEARKQEIKQNEQLKREAEKTIVEKELKIKQEVEKAELEEEDKKEKVRRFEETEKKLKEDAERNKLKKKNLYTDKQQVHKSNKTAAVSVNNNKNNVKNMAKTVHQILQQTNAMKKEIESRGDNNDCNDEFSQWCCKYLATLNKNTIDIQTFVTFLKYVESENEIKDHILNYLGDNKQVREFSKQFFEKRLKIQNKQRSSDFVEIKSKNKKRNKMVPIDTKRLGFNVVGSKRNNIK